MEERLTAIQLSKFIETTNLLDHAIILAAEEMLNESVEAQQQLIPDLDCLQHKQPVLTELWTKITMKKVNETLDE